MNAAAYRLPDEVADRWYPKAETLPGVLAEVAAIAGVPTALALGEAHGHERKYIPDPSSIERGHWLAQAIGVQAARMFAIRHRGETVAIPSAATERKALAVLRLFFAGYSTNRIVAEARISRSQVKRITDGIERPALSSTAPVVDVRCPVCGRQHALKRTAAQDPRQLCLPLSGDRPAD